MVICSDSVKNVIDRLWIEEFVTQQSKSQKGLSNKIKTNLESLDTSVARVHANAVNDVPFSWKRDKKYVLVVDDYKFSYSVIADIVKVDEVYYKGNIIDESKR